MLTYCTHDGVNEHKQGFFVNLFSAWRSFLRTESWMNLARIELYTWPKHCKFNGVGTKTIEQIQYCSYREDGIYPETGSGLSVVT